MSLQVIVLARRLFSRKREFNRGSDPNSRCGSCLVLRRFLTPWQQCNIEALWHSTRFRRLAAWHGAALTVMLAQPSSAPIERVFSMLKSVVDDQQG